MQHAQESRAGDAGTAQDAQAAAVSVRRTISLLAQTGWAAA